MMDYRVGVHRTHCCVLHGCKYGDDDSCPVVNKEIEQKYPCMDCPDSLEEAFQEVNRKYHEYLESIEELEFMKHILKGEQHDDD